MAYTSDGQTTARGPDAAPCNVLSGPRDIIALHPSSNQIMRNF
jgi:hypothetical protein